MDAAVGYGRTNRFNRTVDRTSSRSRHAGVPEEASSVSVGPEPRHNDSADNTDGWNIGADTHSTPANPRDSYERSERYQDRPRHTIQVDYWPYLDAMRAICDVNESASSEG